MSNGSRFRAPLKTFSSKGMLQGESSCIHNFYRPEQDSTRNQHQSPAFPGLRYYIYNQLLTVLLRYSLFYFHKCCQKYVKSATFQQHVVWYGLLAACKDDDLCTLQVVRRTLSVSFVISLSKKLPSDVLDNEN